MQDHRMIFRDKSYYVATFIHLTCVFNIVARLSRYSTDEFSFDTDLDCCGIMLIVTTLYFEFVASLSVVTISSLCAIVDI